MVPEDVMFTGCKAIVDRMDGIEVGCFGIDKVAGLNGKREIAARIQRSYRVLQFAGRLPVFPFAGGRLIAVLNIGENCE